MNPAMVDRALKQTAEAGHTYASVPLPWLMDWLRLADIDGFTFPWFRHCGGSAEWDLDSADMDDDGNVLLCLLPRDHEGDHGYQI